MKATIIISDNEELHKAIHALVKKQNPKCKTCVCKSVEETIEKLKAGGNRILSFTEKQGSIIVPVVKCPEFILLFNDGEKRKVATKNIMYVTASNNCCTFFFADKSFIMTCKPIYYYEEMLGTDTFCRSHQSHLVSALHIKMVEKHKGGMIQLKNLDFVPMSRAKQEDVIKFFRKFKG